MLEVFKYFGMTKTRDILLLTGLIILDQITKILFTEKEYWIINYEINYGAAFSVLQGFMWLFIITAVIVVIILAAYYKHAKIKWPLVFIAAGSIGNMIDRAYLGYVRDFVDIKIWPVFNIADSLNLIGAIALAYYLIKKKV